MGALAPAHAQALARGRWAGVGAGLSWLLTYTLTSVVFAYGATLVVRDMELPPDQQEYHPGIMVTVSRISLYIFVTTLVPSNVQ